MARRPARDMSAVDVKIVASADAGGGGPLGGGLRLLHRITAYISDPAVPFDITMVVGAFEGRLACESFTISQRRNGPIVVGTALRSAVLDSYLSRVREELGRIKGGFVVVKERERSEASVTYTGVRTDEWATFETSQRRDRPVETAEVAELYRQALESTDPTINRAPTAAVGRRLGVHRGHAARLVSRARREGLLGPARAGRAGEAGDPE